MKIYEGVNILESPKIEKTEDKKKIMLNAFKVKLRMGKLYNNVATELLLPSK